jgi:hypothetical protein
VFLNIDVFPGRATRQERPERQERRQRVLDELTELDPEQWPERVDRAIAVGEVPIAERDFVLRVAGQVEKLRVMIVPSPIRWPETELIGVTPRTFASEMIGRSNGGPTGESVAIEIEPEGVDPALLAVFAGEPWPSIAWLRPEIPNAGSQARLGSREALRARKLKQSGRPGPSRRPVRSR